jgi:hypothetical protein
MDPCTWGPMNRTGAACCVMAVPARSAGCLAAGGASVHSPAVDYSAELQMVYYGNRTTVYSWKSGRRHMSCWMDSVIETVVCSGCRGCVVMRLGGCVTVAFIAASRLVAGRQCWKKPLTSASHVACLCNRLLLAACVRWLARLTCWCHIPI